MRRMVETWSWCCGWNSRGKAMVGKPQVQELSRYRKKLRFL